MDGGMSQNTKSEGQNSSAGAMRQLLGLVSNPLLWSRLNVKMKNEGCKLVTLSKEYLKFFLCKLHELTDISRNMKSRLKFTPAVNCKSFEIFYFLSYFTCM